MKFPSLKTLAQSAGKTIKRFPFELLFALAGTIASTTNIELENVKPVGENWCMRIMMVANLGLLLSLSATLFAESRKLNHEKKLLLRIIAALVALSFMFLINPGVREADSVRFFLLSLGLHLLVAFAAFTKAGHIQGFWQFNKTLFLRFLTAALYGIVLFLGLSAAIGAMNYLFNFKFEEDTFEILFTWIVGIFSTTFFLAGVPHDFESLDTDISYPKSLKVFTQYVLIPLATVYVLILLAYEIKILLEWNLPKGAVSYLILSYAVFGILSLLLVHPIRNREENKWLKIYARSFYFLLIPLLGLLFVAAGVRLSDYGITEFRYFLIALALWLLFITIYFLFFKKQNIKIIPISLCIITLLSVYGPQSAFSVSMYSQRHILIEIFKRNKAFKNDKLIKATTMNNKDGNRAADVLDYLVKHHDLSSLQPYINTDLTAVSDSLSKQKDTLNADLVIESYVLRERKLEWAKRHLGLGRFSGYYGNRIYAENGNDEKTTDYDFHSQGDITNIKGYNYLVDAKGYNDTTTELHNGIKFIERKSSYKDYSIEVNQENTSFDLSAFAKKLISSKDNFEKLNNDRVGIGNTEYAVQSDSLMITKQTNHFIITLAINDVKVTQSENGDINITYVSANYLIKEK